jgi:hypothetical protein
MRRPGTAGAILGALSAAVAIAVVLSIKGIPGRSNGGGLVEGFAVMAAVPTAVATILAVQLGRGRASTALVVGWFVVACAALLLLMFVAMLSNSGLGS